MADHRTTPVMAGANTSTDLLIDLVGIDSPSGEEERAVARLVDWMRAHGFDAHIDEAGNAVGARGPADAPHTLMLLGHIDTVPGAIPVRIEGSDDGPVLYGRGSVDAKGPLATFTAAAARLDAAWLRRCNLRVVVVGAVEEEAATSKGARHIRDRFDGAAEPIPAACVIGEPSGWRRVTLGYKGRLLVELSARRPMAHTAGPDAGIAVWAAALWNWLDAYASEFNAGRSRAFDQFQPSLRQVQRPPTQMNDTVWCRPASACRRFDATLPRPGDRAADAAGGAVAHPAARCWPAVRLEPRTSRLTYPSSYGALAQPAMGAGARFLAAIRAGRRRTAWLVVKTGTSDMNVVAPAAMPHPRLPGQATAFGSHPGGMSLWTNTGAVLVLEER